jgi:hypothetical protein
LQSNLIAEHYMVIGQLFIAFTQRSLMLTASIIVEFFDVCIVCQNMHYA